MPQGHSHETTELKLLFLNEGNAGCLESDSLARQTGGRLLVSAMPHCNFVVFVIWLQKKTKFGRNIENKYGRSQSKQRSGCPGEVDFLHIDVAAQHQYLKSHQIIDWQGERGAGDPLQRFADDLDIVVKAAV
jgi:hypothetical protein